ncbi:MULTISPECIES: hypothetical protein [Methylobacter]
MNWKYMDSSGLVAGRNTDDGVFESAIVSSLPEGTMIEHLQTTLTIADYEKAVQDHLDNTAKVRGYGDDRTSPTISIATYDNDPNPRFANDAATFKSWRSSVWTHCYDLLSAVESGTRVAPSIDALLAELPELVWAI